MLSLYWCYTTLKFKYFTYTDALLFISSLIEFNWILNWSQIYIISYVYKALGMHLIVPVRTTNCYFLQILYQVTVLLNRSHV